MLSDCASSYDYATVMVYNKNVVAWSLRSIQLEVTILKLIKPICSLSRLELFESKKGRQNVARNAIAGICREKCH